jgi:hypothetical protein
MKNGDGRTVGECSWRQLYEAAFFELDPKLLPQKIADAEKAIGERALALLRENGQNHSEKKALARAHVALDDLKRIHQTADRSLKDAYGRAA